MRFADRVTNATRARRIETILTASRTILASCVRAADVGQLKGNHAVKNAKELLEDFFKASWRDPKQMVAMFAEDGGLELPYLTDFGYPERFAGARASPDSPHFSTTPFPVFVWRISRSSSRRRTRSSPNTNSPRSRQKQAARCTSCSLAGWWPRTARSSWFARP